MFKTRQSFIERKDGSFIKRIHLRQVFQKQQFVQLIGQVKAPGIYNYYEGMRVKDLLELGGGLEDSTFIKSIYMKKAEIVRRNSGSRYEEIINIDLRILMNEY